MSGYERIRTVYAVQAGKSGPVKIGCCAELCSRLTTMQRDNAQPLRVLMEIEAVPAIEKSLQAYLRAHHLRGEWFLPSQTVLRAISRMKRGWRPPPGAFKPCEHPKWGNKDYATKRRDRIAAQEE